MKQLMRAARFILFLVSVAPIFFVSGCRGVEDPHPVQVHVTVEHLQDGSWLALYHVSKPVQGLVFRRQRHQFRRSTWKVQTSGVVLSVVDGKEALTGANGQTFSDVSLAMTPYTDLTAKDYEFFVPYSDGSLTLFSGHLDALPLHEDPSVDVETDYEFVPAPGESVVVQGQVSQDHLDWTAWRDGTYIYFGHLPVLDFRGFQAVLDPQLPHWMEDEVKKDLPKFFDFYGGKLGLALDFKPLVYLSYLPSEVAISAKGGVLHHQVRLTVSGSTWVSYTPDNIKKFRELLAHETAHFWNADLFLPMEGEGDAWLHEGSADAFAYRSLRALGMISQKDYVADYNQALNRCVLGLGDVALDESDGHGRFQNSYDCGALIGLVTEAAARRSRPTGDLFSFWKKIFDAARSSGGIYSVNTYFDLLKSIDTRSAEDVRQLVTARLTKPDGFFQEVLTRNGVRITDSGLATPAWYDEELGTRASRMILEDDCGAGASVENTYSDFIIFNGAAGCAGLRGTFSVDRVGPFSLIYDGANAYDYIFDQCRRFGSVDFKVFDSPKKLKTPCNEIPPRPHFLSIIDMP